MLNSVCGLEVFFIFEDVPCPHIFLIMDEESKKLVEIAAKNGDEVKKDLAEIKKMVKSIKNHFIREEVYSFLRFLIIIVPLVVGAIYLMPLVEKSMTQYQQLMGFSLDLGNGKAGVQDIQKYVSPDVLKQFEELEQRNK